MARTTPQQHPTQIKRAQRIGYLLMHLKAGRYQEGIDTRSRRARFEVFKQAQLAPLPTLTCYVCDRPEPREWHHIVPISQGGEDREVNVVPLCRGCHRRVQYTQRPRRPSRLKTTKLAIFKPPTQVLVYVPPR